MIRRWMLSPGVWVMVSWLLAVGGRLVKNGVSFGLDYALYQPDGVRYVTLAHALLSQDFGGVDRITASRPLYSVLSLPFYAMLGDQGMLVIPALGLLVVGAVLLAIGHDLGTPWAAVTLFGAISSSVTVNRWMVANITDSLHAAIFAIGCLAILREWRMRWIWLLVILGLLARPAGPAWMALFLPFLLASAGSRRWNWWSVTIFSALATVITLVLVPDVSGVDPNGKVSWAARLARLPERVITIPVVELGQLAVLDRLLLVLVVAALVLAWRSRSRLWSQAYLWVLGITMFMGAWNGVFGVNFRYQLPVLVPAAIVVMEWWVARQARLTANRGSGVRA